MKKSITLLLIILNFKAFAQIGIGTNAPSSSAALELTSKTQGFLMPRMTKAQMEAIEAPAEGLMVYCLDCTPKGFHVYNGKGFINANTGEYHDAPDKIAAIVAASTVPAAGGTPSLADLKAAHITNVTGDQAAYEEAITRASPAPTTLRDLQAIIDNENFCLSVLSSSVAFTAVVPVKNPKTGRIWMDRNLGASRAATSSTDEAAYGDLYQWGRKKDGHQLRTSCSVKGPVTAGSEGYKFVKTPSDWLANQNDKRWNLKDSIHIIKSDNDPCPLGYRIPTCKEFNEEIENWEARNNYGALVSNLKLPLAGRRDTKDGELYHLGVLGRYWCSDPGVDYPSYARYLSFSSVTADIQEGYRGTGYSVRCIKE